MARATEFLPATALRTLGDPVRLRIVALLARPDAACCSIADRVCACDLERVLGLAQPTISHHMKILCDAGLIEPRKAGKFVFYRLNRTRFHKLAGWLTELAGEQKDGPYPQFAEDAA
ncbi:MAG: ArsR/SmtB family transcription factor [Acetobacteraceae bacterium]